MTSPLISIIICTYNRKQFIAETLESVFHQSYSPVEILVIDDGSSDGTDELVKSYKGKVRYFRQENQGITVARNTGCKLAKGEYITFQDDDDPMPPSKLTDLYNAVCLYSNTVFATGDLAYIDNNSNITGERWLPEDKTQSKTPILVEDSFSSILWPKVPATPNTTLFRRRDGERINWFDTKFMVGSEDKDFYARLALLGPIVYLPEVVTYYRRGHESMTKKPFLIAFSQVMLWEKHLASFPAESGDLRRRLQDRLLQALKQMIKYKNFHPEFPKKDYNYYLNSGLSLLGILAKIDFLLYRIIKAPLRRLAKGNN